MAVNLFQNEIQFSKNIFEIENDKIKGPKNILIPIKQTKNLPHKISSWLSGRQNFPLLSFSEPKVKNLKLIEEKPPSLDEGADFLLRLKPEEQKELEINYTSSSSNKVIRIFLFLEKKSSLNFTARFTESSPQVETYILAEENARVHFMNMRLFDKQSGSSFVHAQFKEKTSFFGLDINFSSSESNFYIESQNPKNISLIKGLNLLDGRQQASQKIIHLMNAENCICRHFYRNALGGRSRCGTLSKAVINAQGADSNQMIQSLILSPLAKAKARPELEVNKDQVKANHGTAIGRPNAAEIFYLNTRGLSDEDALRFIASGWVDKIIENTAEENKYMPAEFKNFRDKIKKPMTNILHQRIEQMLFSKKTTSQEMLL